MVAAIVVVVIVVALVGIPYTHPLLSIASFAAARSTHTVHTFSRNGMLPH